MREGILAVVQLLLTIVYTMFRQREVLPDASMCVHRSCASHDLWVYVPPTCYCVNLSLLGPCLTHKLVCTGDG